MPEARSIGEVASELLPRVDSMATEMVAAYRVRIPEYPRLLEKHGEDVYAVSRLAVLLFLHLVIEKRDASDSELGVIRAAGRARAAQGLAPEAMLHAYSIGREVAWGILAREAEKAGVAEEEISDATLIMTRFMERLALLVTQGFLDHMRVAFEAERQRMAVLVEIAKAMSRSLDLDEVVTVGLDRLRRALGVEWAGLWLVWVEKGSLRLYGQQADPVWSEGGLGDAFAVIPLDEPVIGRDVVAGKPVLYTGDTIPSAATGAGARMMMIVPLLHRERPLGAVGIASRRLEDLDGRDREFMIAIAEQMAVAVHQVQEHMREARTDFLTGLANRHEFDSFLRRELARAERFHDPLSLAMIDLDDLKLLNDDYGHKAGDEALRTIGATLKATVRSLDLAARIGGDEFALVMPQTDATGANDVLARFLQRVSEVDGGAQPRTTVSIGFRQWEEGMTLDALCSAADAELYEAKRTRSLAKNEA